MPTPAQIANTLITFFCSEHKRVLGTTVVVNRHTAKWGVQDIVKDLGEERARELIKFFFKTTRNKYDLNTFLNSYDRLNESYEEIVADEKNRAKLREATRRKVEEWEAKYGKA